MDAKKAAPVFTALNLGRLPPAPSPSSAGSCSIAAVNDTVIQLQSSLGELQQQMVNIVAKLDELKAGQVVTHDTTLRDPLSLSARDIQSNLKLKAGQVVTHDTTLRDLLSAKDIQSNRTCGTHSWPTSSHYTLNFAIILFVILLLVVAKVILILQKSLQLILPMFISK